MAEVKWIKLTIDMFDNRKIKHLRKLPDGNSIVLIWVMLLTMAGRCNANGMIFLTENIPYTPKMLADELDFEENTVQLALKALEEFNMIVTDGDYLTIAGWEEYQSVERLNELKEYNRIKKRESRKRQRLLQDVNDTSLTCQENVTDMSLTCQRRQDIDIEKDKDKEIDKEIIKEIHKEKPTPQQIVDLFNSICVSFPSVRSLSEARKKAINARLNTYTIDDFKTLFEIAESSSFLKGGNERNWIATFDWLIKDANMPKVLEGNYANKSNNGKPDKVRYGNFNVKESFERAVIRGFEEKPQPKTAANDENIRKKAEEIKKRLG